MQIMILINMPERRDTEPPSDNRDTERCPPSWRDNVTEAIESSNAAIRRLSHAPDWV